MSLPNYLAKIKSAGVYRYVFDKSVVPSQYVDTLRLLIGYSDKGPFNTPVYIDNASDFINTFGNISKKLEKKGSFFHRSALQALDGGPILALNLKPFDETNSVWCDALTPGKDMGKIAVETKRDDKGVDNKVIPLNFAAGMTKPVVDLYDTNRFWKIDADQLPSKISKESYLKITSTGPLDKSCTVFMRKYTPSSYDISFFDWYSNNTDQEMPDYILGHEGDKVNDYFAEVFVFRGKFTKELIKAGSTLSDYFFVEGDNVYLREDILTSTGEVADTLELLADDPNSNFVSRYRGCLLPYFKDANDRYISLDILFNVDNYTHNMLMKIDEDWFYTEDADLSGIKIGNDDAVTPGGSTPSKMAGMTVYLGEGQYDPETGRPNFTGSANYIYLVPTGSDGDNQHVEWVYDPLTKTWEILGGSALSTDDIDAAVGIRTLSDEDSTEPVAVAEEEIVNDAIYKYLYYAYVQGYDYKFDNDTIKNSLNMLNDKGIYAALTNNVDSNYHYLVDTYKSNIDTNLKKIIFGVAKAKDNCLALVNFPPMQDFVSTGKFIDRDGKFDINKLAENGHGFSVVSSNQGASWGAYFTSIIVSDGTVKEVIPSAAAVSNNFVEKFDTRQPYDIVAGPKYGVITVDGLVGPDYNYSRSDLDVLEPLGINAIVYVPRKGTYINSNQTAKQVPVSALSKIHVRELVIYLQDEIEALLQSYQWDKNTASLRATIKSKADTILENIMLNDGVYAYKNTCDETNNTSEVIDNEMIILDTDIEPARGAGKLVQRLTIHKTGAISSTSV